MIRNSPLANSGQIPFFSHQIHPTSLLKAVGQRGLHIVSQHHNQHMNCMLLSQLTIVELALKHHGVWVFSSTYFHLQDMTSDQMLQVAATCLHAPSDLKLIEACILFDELHPKQNLYHHYAFFCMNRVPQVSSLLYG